MLLDSYYNGHRTSGWALNVGPAVHFLDEYSGCTRYDGHGWKGQFKQFYQLVVQFRKAHLELEKDDKLKRNRWT